MPHLWHFGKPSNLCKRGNTDVKPPDIARFTELARELWQQQVNIEEGQEWNDDVIRQFAACCAGHVAPIQSIIGGIAAQEVIKACTGKFVPIQQWLYYDALECLPDTEHIDSVLTEQTCAPTGCRYDGQIAVFGSEFQKLLSNARFFLVGVGAIGCEMLKNWAMMGVATGSRGLVTATDMDHIERSNLNRQFLFRPWDIQKAKSSTATEAVKRMNSALKIEAHENKVGVETESVYDDDFYNDLTAVVNALDNVPARVYMDRRCIYFNKPLFESGTMGTRCNWQPIIPGLTESYGSAGSSATKSIPICTLKNFPNAIEHTLQWARDQFEGIFRQQIQTAQEYLSNREAFLQQTRNLSAYLKRERLEAVRAVLVESRADSFSDCVQWARIAWQTNYCNQIRQILYSFPPDHVTTSGLPFWFGTKRCPHPLHFDPTNSLHMDYIVSAANLLASVFGLKQSRDRAAIADLLSKVTVPDFTPSSSVRVEVNDEEVKTAQENSVIDDAEFNALISSLPDPASFAGRCLYPAEFEKDDETNFHMDFIVAASNLRAENYDIEPADMLKSKLIAGRIIPAIATTTSVVVGFVCIELYKLLQGHHKLQLFKNGYVNLAGSYFGLSQPLPAPAKKYGDTEFTDWDRFEVDEKTTVGEFINKFQKEHGLTVEAIMYGKCAVLSSLTTDENRKLRLSLPFDKAVESVLQQSLPANTKSLRLELRCTNPGDPDGNDVDVPFVKCNLHRRL